MSILDKAKDIAVLVTINYLLGDIGRVSALVIDRTSRQIRCKLELRGEPQLIDLTVDQWEYGDVSSPNRVRILGMDTSKPWLTAIAERAVIRRWFSIPPQHMGKLRRALD
jgi:hypothetical protein